jgi:hypothetical protein
MIWHVPLASRPEHGAPLTHLLCSAKCCVAVKCGSPPLFGGSPRASALYAQGTGTRQKEAKRAQEPLDTPLRLQQFQSIPRLLATEVGARLDGMSRASGRCAVNDSMAYRCPDKH